jgi:hypothetical protein
MPPRKLPPGLCGKDWSMSAAGRLFFWDADVMDSDDSEDPERPGMSKTYIEETDKYYHAALAAYRAQIKPAGTWISRNRDGSSTLTKPGGASAHYPFVPPPADKRPRPATPPHVWQEPPLLPDSPPPAAASARPPAFLDFLSHRYLRALREQQMAEADLRWRPRDPALLADVARLAAVTRARHAELVRKQEDAN